MTFNKIAINHVGPMVNPPHLGELIHESMEEVGWNITETTTQLGCERGALSRFLNCKTGISANMALERTGWGTVDHWMRTQASQDLAETRGDRTESEWQTGTLCS